MDNAEDTNIPAANPEEEEVAGASTTPKAAKKAVPLKYIGAAIAVIVVLAIIGTSFYSGALQRSGLIGNSSARQSISTSTASTSTSSSTTSTPTTTIAQQSKVCSISAAYPNTTSSVYCSFAGGEANISLYAGRFAYADLNISMPGGNATLYNSAPVSAGWCGSTSYDELKPWAAGNYTLTLVTGRVENLTSSQETPEVMQDCMGPANASLSVYATTVSATSTATTSSSTTSMLTTTILQLGNNCTISINSANSSESGYCSFAGGEANISVEGGNFVNATIHLSNSTGVTTFGAVGCSLVSEIRDLPAGNYTVKVSTSSLNNISSASGVGPVKQISECGPAYASIEAAIAPTSISTSTSTSTVGTTSTGTTSVSTSTTSLATTTIQQNEYENPYYMSQVDAKALLGLEGAYLDFDTANPSDTYNLNQAIGLASLSAGADVYQMWGMNYTNSTGCGCHTVSLDTAVTNNTQAVYNVLLGESSDYSAYNATEDGIIYSVTNTTSGGETTIDIYAWNRNNEVSMFAIYTNSTVSTSTAVSDVVSVLSS